MSKPETLNGIGYGVVLDVQTHLVEHEKIQENQNNPNMFGSFDVLSTRPCITTPTPPRIDRSSLMNTGESLVVLHLHYFIDASTLLIHACTLLIDALHLHY